MTETPNIFDQEPGKEFSGVYEFLTPKGPVIMKVEKAVILLGEETLGENTVEPMNVDSLVQAYKDLGAFMDSVKNKSHNKNWQRNRRIDMELYGEYSMLALFPENVKKSTTLVIGATNFLKRHGIKNLKDLSSSSVSQLKYEKGFGDRYFEFTSLLKKIAQLKFPNSI